MNQVTLIGRLTKDIELRYSQNEKAYAKFTLAVANDFDREKADFINCTAWNKTAEILAQYTRKADKIAVQGRLSVSDYEKNGEKRYITEVIIDKFEFIETKKREKQNFDEEINDDSFPF